MPTFPSFGQAFCPPSSCLHPSPTSLHLFYSCQRLSTPANILSYLLPPPLACLSTSVHYLRSFIKVSLHQMSTTYFLLPLSTGLLPTANPTSIHPTPSFFFHPYNPALRLPSAATISFAFLQSLHPLISVCILKPLFHLAFTLSMIHVPLTSQMSPSTHQLLQTLTESLFPPTVHLPSL